MKLSRRSAGVAIVCVLFIGLVLSEPNPCLKKRCNPSEDCREVEMCHGNQCFRVAECLSKRDSRFLSGGCLGQEEPLLIRHPNGTHDLRTCYNDYNCEADFYCSTRLMDVSSRCCRTSAAPRVKDGSCPAVKSSDSFFCVDGCRSDSDCDWDMKCCTKSSQCSRKECTSPEPCSLRNCPAGTECVVDPDFNTHCAPTRPPTRPSPPTRPTRRPNYPTRPTRRPNRPIRPTRPSPLIMQTPIIRVTLSRCPDSLQPVDWDRDCASGNFCNPLMPRQCSSGQSCCPSYYCGRYICRTLDRVQA